MNRKKLPLQLQININNLQLTFVVFLCIISVTLSSTLKTKSKLSSHSISQQENGGDLKLKEQLNKYDELMRTQAGTNTNRIPSDNEMRFIEKAKNEILKRSKDYPISNSNVSNNGSAPRPRRISGNIEINVSSSNSFLQLNREISPIDDPSRFFNTKFEANLNKLPKSGQVDKTPWSSYFWPTKNGQISVRYNLNNRNSIGRFDYTQGTIIELYNLEQSINSYSQPEEYLQVLKDEPENLEYYIYDNFSPSEKYDFLVGDMDFTLTNYLKKHAKDTLKTYGTVPEWHGISHGSSLASYIYDKPNQQVVLTAADKKTQIYFMPEDIKALASLYWANSKYTINIIGGVCSNPAEIEQCFSINPASLLITLSNHVGVGKKNLILDPMSDQEITNRAIINYSANFFNVLNENFYSDINSNKVNIHELKNSSDKFLQFVHNNANKLATHVLGVMFTITYANSVFPYHSPYPTPDNCTTETYVGVIELDSSDNLIGGEWKYNASNSHPNFMWKVDEVLGDNDVKFEGVPNENIKNLAVKASQNGQVLKGIVEYLVNMARDEGWGYVIDDSNINNENLTVESTPSTTDALNSTNNNSANSSTENIPITPTIDNSNTPNTTNLPTSTTSNLPTSTPTSNINEPISTTVNPATTENNGFMDAAAALTSIRSALSGISGNTFRFDNINSYNSNNGSANSSPSGNTLGRDNNAIPTRTPTPIANSNTIRLNNEDFISNTLNLVRAFNNVNNGR
jgi:hypothetical protein